MLLRAYNYVFNISNNVARLEDYSLQVHYNENRLKYRKEQLLKEKAMIENEIRFINSELVHNEQQKQEVQQALANINK